MPLGRWLRLASLDETNLRGLVGARAAAGPSPGTTGLRSLLPDIEDAAVATLLRVGLLETTSSMRSTVPPSRPSRQSTEFLPRESSGLPNLTEAASDRPDRPGGGWPRNSSFAGMNRIAAFVRRRFQSVMVPGSALSRFSSAFVVSLKSIRRFRRWAPSVPGRTE